MSKNSRCLLMLPMLIVLFFVYAKAGTESVVNAEQPKKWEEMFVQQASKKHDTQSIMIKFQPQTPKSVRHDIVKMLGGSYKDKNGDGIDDRYGNFADGCWMKVTMDKKIGTDDAFDALSMLQGDSNISYAEFNFECNIDVIPNDTRFSELWAMNQANDCDIDAPEAWDITTGSQNVVVGIIDTGIDYNHNDLSANVWTNPNEIAGNGIDEDNNGYVDDVHGINSITGTGNPMDDNDHGTHCTGTIGAIGNNGNGVIGVNWKVKMIGMKFLNSAGSGNTADAVECVNYAIGLKRKGINLRVLNNSWSGGGFEQVMLDAITEANSVGILFVAASGNSGSNNDATPHYPASYNSPNVLAVAATTNIDSLASFSNYGASTVDLGAPGQDILSSTRNNTYQIKSGTSMATPHVAGAAALLLSKKNDLTVPQLKGYLMNYGDPIPNLYNKCVSGTRLNLRKSLDAVIADNPSLTLTSPNGSESWNCGSTYTIKWSSNNVTNVKIELMKGGVVNSNIILSTASDGSHNWTIPSAQAPGNDYKIRITDTTNSSITDSSNANFSIKNNDMPAPVLPSGCGTIKAGYGLGLGNAFYSCDGRFRLRLNSDGNLVLYQNNVAALWASNTTGKSAFGAYMQADGNLVIYTKTRVALWSSKTGGNPGSRLVIQNDGNMVIYTAQNKAIWSTHTGGH